MIGSSVQEGPMGTKSRYVEEFFRLRCAPDVLSSRVFPNVEELTESFGAVAAVFQHLDRFKRHDATVRLFAVGDGCTPRTAALFAFLTRWDCYSVDPRLRCKSWPIARLTCVPRRVEELGDEMLDSGTGQAVIVAVHSHASLMQSWEHLSDVRTGMVSIPCCLPDDVPWDPDVTYQDAGIWSPHNWVHVWTLGGVTHD